MKEKKELREEIKHRLAGIPFNERTEKSKRICRHVLQTEEFQRASVVMAFLSMPHEVDTTPIILHAWQQGKSVAVPKVSWQQRHMIPVEIQSLEAGITAENTGLRNPISGVPMPLEDIDLVLTPGLCFDAHGNRLGRGGAYYDRFFQSERLSCPRWALAFELQILPLVPHGEGDISVDAIVNETGILYCNTDVKQGGPSSGPI